MKNHPKTDPQNRDAEISEEYDFSGAVLGKYAKQYQTRTNVVLLDPDVAEVFPDAESVNDALRSLAKIVKRRQQETKSR